MYRTDQREIAREHVRVKVSKPFAVNRKWRKHQVVDADDAFAFFAAQKQKTFPWIELFCPCINGVQQFLWKLNYYG